MADYDTFRIGGVTYPLAAPTPATALLQQCDPAIYWALAFYDAVLTHHVGPVLVAAAAACGAPISAAVASRISYDPGPHLFTRPDLRFPMLAVFRTTTRYTDRTVTWTGEESEWGIAYVLPVLAPAQATILLPILRAVAQTIRHCTDQGFDPAYSAGVSVWDDAHGAIDRIAITEGSYGVYDDSRGLPIHSWFGKASVRERTMPVAGSLTPFAAGDATISSTVDGTDPIDVVSLYSDIAPPAAG